MSSLNALQQRLSKLEAQLEAIRQEGEYLMGVRLERSPAGGTASRNAKESSKYARLRAGRGKLLPNGKRSMYVSVQEIARYDAACERGGRLQKLERELNQVKAQIAKLEQSQYRSLKGKRRRFPVQKPSPQTSSLQPIFPSTMATTFISDRPNQAVIEIEPPLTTPAAILVLYRQNSHAPVHAIAAEVWQGDQKIAEVKAVHCMGMKGDRVSAYIKEILASLSQQFGVTRFEDVIKEVPVNHCPISNCPLKVVV